LLLNSGISINSQIQTTNPTKIRPETNCCGIAEMKSKILTFRDRFDIPLEKRLSSVAGLMYIMLYGKSQLEVFGANKTDGQNKCI